MEQPNDRNPPQQRGEAENGTAGSGGFVVLVHNGGDDNYNATSPPAAGAAVAAAAASTRTTTTTTNPNPFSLSSPSRVSWNSSSETLVGSGSELHAEDDDRGVVVSWNSSPTLVGSDPPGPEPSPLVLSPAASVSWNSTPTLVGSPPLSVSWNSSSETLVGSGSEPHPEDGRDNDLVSWNSSPTLVGSLEEEEEDVEPEAANPFSSVSWNNSSSTLVGSSSEPHPGEAEPDLEAGTTAVAAAAATTTTTTTLPRTTSCSTVFSYRLPLSNKQRCVRVNKARLALAVFASIPVLALVGWAISMMVRYWK
ncbi:hypothetical protein IWZ00DRAFT_493258 [Phyllosticta capitalensis]